jgi:hypothetical protein
VLIVTVLVYNLKKNRTYKVGKYKSMKTYNYSVSLQFLCLTALPSSGAHSSVSVLALRLCFQGKKSVLVRIEYITHSTVVSWQFSCLMARERYGMEASVSSFQLKLVFKK